MKTIPAYLAALAAATLIAAPQNARAAIALLEIDISPMTGAANLGTTIYTRDHAAGISGANVGNTPIGSMATGNEVGAAITYDSATKNLSFDFAYGSAFGFVDLQGAFSNVHFHAPGVVNFPAANSGGGVIISLAGFHTASGTFSGRVTGSATLTAGQETNLFNNEIYINIHSAADTGGEIRGQLVVVPEPGAALLAVFAAPLFLRRRR